MTTCWINDNVLRFFLKSLVATSFCSWSNNWTVNLVDMCKKIHGEIGHDFHEFFLKDEQREKI
jgi:hypothetical protein